MGRCMCFRTHRQSNKPWLPSAPLDSSAVPNKIVHCFLQALLSLCYIHIMTLSSPGKVCDQLVKQVCICLRLFPSPHEVHPLAPHPPHLIKWLPRPIPIFEIHKCPNSLSFANCIRTHAFRSTWCVCSVRVQIIDDVLLGVCGRRVPEYYCEHIAMHLEHVFASGLIVVS